MGWGHSSCMIVSEILGLRTYEYLYYLFYITEIVLSISC